MAANQTRLLRDLLRVVDLRNINHENICCLNTAVVVAIFAHRRGGLAQLIDELFEMSEEDKEQKRASQGHSQDLKSNIVAAGGDATPSLISGFQSLELDSQGTSKGSCSSNAEDQEKPPALGDRSDVLRNFRELLWFWSEYYTHRGRDRLSLEFSSHLRFQEWDSVVGLLCADNGSNTSLLSHPIHLPRSPYTQAPRTAEAKLRTF